MHLFQFPLACILAMSARHGIESITFTSFVRNHQETKSTMELRPGSPIQGVLSNSDALVLTPKTKPYAREAPTRGREYTVTVPESGSYIITLYSNFFDPYLVLRNSNGDILAEDDDGYLRVHSRITYELNSDAVYRINACGIRHASGAFTLSIAKGKSDHAPTQSEILDEASKRVDFLRRNDSEASISLAEALEAYGQRLRESFQYSQAIEMLQEKLDVERRTLGTEHERLAFTLNHIGVLHFDMGQLDQAEARHREALKILEAVSPPDHPSVSHALHYLGIVLAEKRRLDEAEEMLLKALEIRESLYPPGFDYILKTVDGLAFVYLLKNDISSANEQFNRIREHDPSKWPIDFLNNYVLFLLDVGDYSTAAEIATIAIEVYESGIGQESLQTAIAYANFAMLPGVPSSFDLAYSYLRRAISILDKLFGPLHPRSVESKVLAVRFLVDHYRFQEADEMLESVLGNMKYLRVNYPLLHATASITKAELLLAYHKDLIESRRIVESVIKTRTAYLGVKHVDTRNARSTLGAIHNRIGNFDKAAEIFNDEIDALQSDPITNPLWLATAKSNLGLIERHRGNLAAAVELLRDSTSKYEKIFGLKHMATARGYFNLAGTLREHGSLQESLDFFAKALDILEDIFPGDHPLIALTRNGIGVVQYDLGKYDLALNEQVKCLEIQRSNLPQGHPDISVTLNNMALAELNLGRNDSAWEYSHESLEILNSYVSKNLVSLSESERFQITRRYSGNLETFLSILDHLGEPSNRLQAFEVFHHWKGRVLRSLSEDFSKTRTEPKEEFDSLVKELQSCRHQLSEIARSPFTAEGAALRIESLLSQYNQLQRAMASKLDSPITSPPSFEDYRSSLPNGVAVVIFSINNPYLPASAQNGSIESRGTWLKPRVRAWVLRSNMDAPAYLDLGSLDEIENEIQSILLSIENRKHPDYDTFRQLVWNPIESELGHCDTIALFPEGPLYAIPFGIITLDSEEYAIESYKFAYFSDIEQIQASKVARPKEMPSFLAIGGINYNGKAGQFLEANTGELNQNLFHHQLAPLPGSMKECQFIANLHSENFPHSSRLFLTESSAIKSRVMSELERYDVALLSVHGYVGGEILPRFIRETGNQSQLITTFSTWLANEVPGLYAGFYCSPDRTESESANNLNVVTAEEIKDLDLSSLDFAVLAACGTAMGQIRELEEMMGLRQAFHAAGARTIVSTLWRVGDTDTHAFVDSLFQNLWVKKRSKLDAVHEAKLAILRRNVTRYEEGRPWEWGGFVISGESYQ